MTKQQLAVEIASALFGKRVGAENWKVRDLQKLSKYSLEDIYKLAEKADPKFGVRERCKECGSEPCFCNEVVSEGWTRQQLKRAFDRVCDPDDWRGPISANIFRSDVNITLAAVNFFTGTVGVVTDLGNLPGYVVIKAEGYRNGPAGDH